MDTLVLQKWGNSQGIRIPKHILDSLSIRTGESFEYEVVENALVLKSTKKKKRRGKYKLNDLLSQVNSDFKNEEYNWGECSEKETF